MKTIKVRIAVKVNAEGKWAAAGESDWTDETAMEYADDAMFNIGGGQQHALYVTAEVPVPEQPADVAGEVAA